MVGHEGVYLLIDVEHYGNGNDQGYGENVGAQKLLDEGFQEVVNLDKGYNSWKEAGMEVRY